MNPCWLGHISLSRLTFSWCVCGGGGVLSLSSRSRIDLSPTHRPVVNGRTVVTADWPPSAGHIALLHQLLSAAARPFHSSAVARFRGTGLCECEVNLPAQSNAWTGMDELGEMWVWGVWEAFSAAVQPLLSEPLRLLRAVDQLRLLQPVNR